MYFRSFLAVLCGSAVTALLWLTPLVQAQTLDITSWTESLATHPSGTLYSQGDATFARYPMASLDAANGGGLANVPQRDALARMEWALSIIEMSMADFTLSSLSGMPAAVGTVETYDGEVSFAASFTGREGSRREMLNIFYAPKNTFDAMGGMNMLVENRPRATVNYAGTTSPRTQQVVAPKPEKVRPAYLPLELKQLRRLPRARSLMA